MPNADMELHEFILVYDDGQDIVEVGMKLRLSRPFQTIKATPRSGGFYYVLVILFWGPPSQIFWHETSKKIILFLTFLRLCYVFYKMNDTKPYRIETEDRYGRLYDYDCKPPARPS